jgi:beta-phosphoglucomutase-like phosphatase (HAD superfamily)
MGIATGLVFEDSDAGITSARLAGFNVVPISEPAELSQIVCRELSSSPRGDFRGIGDEYIGTF